MISGLLLGGKRSKTSNLASFSKRLETVRNAHKMAAGARIHFDGNSNLKLTFGALSGLTARLSRPTAGLVSRLVTRGMSSEADAGKGLKSNSENESKTVKVDAKFPLRSIGQPIYGTHPHLFRNLFDFGDQELNEKDLESLVTPGVSRDEFESRRRKLVATLPPKSLAIIPGQGLRFATGSIFYPFHQQTDLYYLSGFNQPDCCLVLASKDLQVEANVPQFTMFVQPYDPHTEIWDGPRAGLEGAKEIFGADRAYPISTFEMRLNNMIKTFPSISNIFTNLPLDQPLKHSILDGTHIQVGSSSATHNTDKIEASTQLSNTRLNPELLKSSLFFSKKIKVKPLGGLVSEARLYKSKAEHLLMRQSGRIAGRAFAEAMKATKPGMTEHQISAILEFHGKMKGATGLSYVPVVGGGKNALTLHYVQNTQILKDGDLLLVDAGVEFNGYASDITRTWPVNGTFSPAQRELYECVLNVQKEIIKRVAPNNTSLDALQNETFEILRTSLSNLLKRPITFREMNKLYPHHVSHYIGLDVHDTSSISRTRLLEEGMTITIEPGLYIPDEEMYGAYRGIGIRIEDDVLVTNEGPVILTVEAPKEIADIEHLMKQK